MGKKAARIKELEDELLDWWDAGYDAGYQVAMFHRKHEPDEVERQRQRADAWAKAYREETLRHV